MRASLVVVLFLLLLGFGGGRIKPRPTAASKVLWEYREQLLPVAVPDRPPPVAPQDEARLGTWLDAHSVDWGTPGATGDCFLYLRISLQHWARLVLDRNRVAEVVAGEPVRPAGLWLSCSYSADDFLDDDDHDGDPFDAGELKPARSGAEALLFCPGSPAAEQLSR